MIPLQDLSPFALAVTLASLLLGIVTGAINTGKFFGQFAVPAKAMVWLLLVAPFLGGFSASLQAAGVFTLQSVVAALLAGIGDVVAGAAPTAVLHGSVLVHLQLPRLVAQLRARAANDNAAPKKEVA